MDFGGKDKPRKLRKSSWTRYALVIVGVPLLCAASLRLFPNARQAKLKAAASVVEEAQPEHLALRHLANIYTSNSKQQRDVLRPPAVRLAWVAHSSNMPGGNVFNYGASIAQISCYASQKGIPFFLELADYGKPGVLMDPMTSRHYATEKHLKNYDWVIFADLDVFIADSRIDLRFFLDDSIDVILPDRENGEICACAYMVRNSPGGFAFVRRWIEWGTGRRAANTDNGDLCEMVMAGMATGGYGRSNGETRQSSLDSLASSHQASRNPDLSSIDVHNSDEIREVERKYAEDFLPSFKKAMAPFREADPKAPYWETTLWPNTRTPSKVRVYRPFSGLIRTAGAEVEDWMIERMPWGQFAVPGDFMMHAKNAKSRIRESLVRCTEKNWQIDHRTPLHIAREQLRGYYPNFWGCQFADNGTLTYVCD